MRSWTVCVDLLFSKYVSNTVVLQNDVSSFGFWADRRCSKRPAQVVGSTIGMWVDVVVGVDASRSCGPPQPPDQIVDTQTAAKDTFV
mmetsp:Transcript_19336/g.39746  ORF Transcript_19336/g.39746 Transcript_19336/m.39746 type:complete len:87 (-) Transcript_19336:395-655(-)